MASSKTLRRRQRDLMEFDSALGHLLAVLEPVHNGLSGERTWLVPDGNLDNKNPYFAGIFKPL